MSRVVIRTREYLALVVPRGAARLLILIRYPQGLIPADEYRLPSRAHLTHRLGKRELQMSRQLVEAMSGEWQYQDNFCARRSKVVAARLRRKGAPVEPPTSAAPTEGSGKVIDLIAVLKRSLEQKGGKRRGALPHARVQELRSGSRG